jgi:hypothetical protein
MTPADQLPEPPPEEQEEPEPEPSDPSQLYWAARPGDLLIAELDKKEKGFYDFIARRGFGDAFLGAYCAYYGLDPDSLRWEAQSVGFDGQDGELLRFRVNEARSYQKQSTAMAIGQRPSFTGLAVNTDYDTLAQIETTDTAINYLYWANYGERKERGVVEKGDLFGVAWTWLSFDPQGGDEVEIPVPLPPDMGGGPSPRTQKVRTGEMIVKGKAVWDVFYEPLIEEFSDHVWRCARDKVSKYELAAKFPEHKAKLLQLSCSDEYAIETLFGFDRDSMDTDELVCKHFYHARTRALPEGRYVLYVGKLALYDGPLPFRVLPFADYCPARYIGTALGYAEFWDLIPVGQMFDQVISDAASIVANLGRPTLFVDDGTEWDAQQIADGFRVLRLRPGAREPGAVNFGNVSQGQDWLYKLLIERFQSLSGLNPTSRGQSAPNVTSGTMAALYHSIAAEINSAKQLAVDAHRETVVNLMLDIVKDYVQTPLLVEIAGADERPYLQSISADQFRSIRKVIIRTASPMLRTQAGRLEIANMLMKVPGAVQTPAQLIEVIVSGQLKPLYRAPRSALLRIAYENEVLAKGARVVEVPDPSAPIDPTTGMPVINPATGMPPTLQETPDIPVLATDNPKDHVNEALSVLASPAALQNKAVKDGVMAHIGWHLRVWREMDPALAMLMGFPPPPQLGGMVPPGMEAQPANDNGIPEGSIPEAPKERDSTGVELPKPAQPPGGMNGANAA